MEKEELNIIWESYNRKLDKCLNFNEAMLRKVNLNQVKKELAIPVHMEVAVIVLTFVFIVYLSLVSVLIVTELRFSIPGFIAAGSALVLTGFARSRIKSFKKLDYVHSSVIRLQKDLNTIQYKKYRWGRIELLLGICSATLMWPLVLYTGFQIDVYEKFLTWFIALCVVAIVAIPVTIHYERYYRKKLKNVRDLLAEIEDFEAEEK